jgi:hypothetical protein
VSHRAPKLSHVGRLQAFKDGSYPYGQRLPGPTERDVAVMRAAVERSFAKGAWRTTHGHRRSVSDACDRLWRAAVSLPDVYGTPNAGPAVAGAVEQAKELARSLKPLAALLAAHAATKCGLRELVEAVLAMPGARQ